MKIRDRMMRPYDHRASGQREEQHLIRQLTPLPQKGDAYTKYNAARLQKLQLNFVKFSRSVLVPGAVFGLAKLAKRRRKAIVDTMLYRRDRPQIGEHCFEFIVGHEFGLAVRHSRIQLTCLDRARSQGLE